MWCCFPGSNTLQLCYELRLTKACILPPPPSQKQYCPAAAHFYLDNVRHVPLLVPFIDIPTITILHLACHPASAYLEDHLDGLRAGVSPEHEAHVAPRRLLRVAALVLAIARVYAIRTHRLVVEVTPASARHLHHRLAVSQRCDRQGLDMVWVSISSTTYLLTVFQHLIDRG